MTTLAVLNTNIAIMRYIVLLKLVALDSYYFFASFGVFEVYFGQNNKNIYTLIFGIYFEIAVILSKSQSFEKFQLEHV